MAFLMKHFIDHHRQLKDTGETAKDVFIYLVAGAAFLIGIVVLTYLTTIVIDWLSKRFDPYANSSNIPTRFEQHDAAMAAAAAAATMTANIPEGRSIDDYDRGSMARQANLWGLEITERELILQKIFPTMSFEYNANELPVDVPVNTSMKDATDNREQPVVPTDIEMASMSPSTKNDTGNDTTIAPEEAAINTTTREDDTSNDDGDSKDMAVSKPDDGENNDKDAIVIQDDTDHYRMCCICLNPYENGVRVLTGVQCQHMFHESCCQQWLLKHDHCPYCRKNMILATDFRNGAEQTLSPDRMVELSVIPTTTTTRRQPPPQPNRIIVLSS
jgi:Ring finger domain